MATTLREKPNAKHDAFITDQLDKAEQRIRYLDLATAVAGWFAGTLAYLVLVMLLDRAFVLSAPTRQFALVIYLLLSGVYLWFTVVRPLRWRVNPYYAARQLEHTLPGSRNHVINWIDLHDEKVPGVIRTAIGQRAAKDLANTDVEQAISNRRAIAVGSVAGVLLATVLFLFVLLGPGPFASLFGRAFAPFGRSNGIATRTQLTIVRPKDGDATVTIGSPVTIAADVSGRVPDVHDKDAPCLLYRHEDGEPYRKRFLQYDEYSRHWTATVTPLDVGAGFAYKLTAGDAETPEHRIRVRATPLIADFVAIYRYRPYVQKADRSRITRKLEDLCGTEVEILARTNRVIKDGRLDFVAKEGAGGLYTATVLAEDPQTLRFTMVLERTGKYRIRFTSTDGDSYTDPMEYDVVAFPDLTPEVTLTLPGKDTTAPVNGHVEVAGEAGDDHGIAAMALHLQVVGRTKLPAKGYLAGKLGTKEIGTPRRVEYKDVLDLGSLPGLKAGMQIEYWLEATDACDYPKANVGVSKKFVITLTEAKEEAQKEKEAAKQKQKEQEKQQEQQLKQDKAERDKQREKEQQQEQDEQNGRKEKGSEKEKQDGERNGEKKAEKEKKDNETRDKADELKNALDKRDQDKQGEKKPGEAKDDGEQKPGENKDEGKQERKPGESKGGAPDEKSAGEKKEGDGKGDNKQGEGRDGKADGPGDKGNAKEPDGKAENKPGEGKTNQPAKPQEGKDKGQGNPKDAQKAGERKPEGDIKPEDKVRQGEGKDSKTEGKPTGEERPGEKKEGAKPSESKSQGKPGEREDKPGEGKPGENNPSKENKPGEGKSCPNGGQGGDGAKAGESKGQGEGKESDANRAERKTDGPAAGKPGEGGGAKAGENKADEGMGAMGQAEGKDGTEEGQPGKAEAKGGKDGQKEGEPSPGTGKGHGNDHKPGDGQAGERQAGGGADDGKPQPAAKEKPVRSRPSAMQLEEFRKKVDPQVLKDAKMSKEQYEQFLRDYAELAKRQEAGRGDVEAPAGRSGPMANMGGKVIKPAAGAKSDDVRGGGRAKPPPEYRDAYKEFLQKLPGK